MASCDVIASLDLGAVGERNDRAAEYAREGDFEDDDFFSSLPLLERQWLKRAESMADNPSFDPQKRPALVPLNFRQIPWNNEIALLHSDADARLSSDFGWRGLFGSKDFHSGIDISNKRGTPIYAAAAGRVVESTTVSGYGRKILIDHGFGITTTYAHCSVLHVEAGEVVEQGQLIARVGSTGRVSRRAPMTERCSHWISVTARGPRRPRSPTRPASSARASSTERTSSRRAGRSPIHSTRPGRAWRRISSAIVSTAQTWWTGPSPAPAARMVRRT